MNQRTDIPDSIATLDEQERQTRVLENIERQLESPVPVRFASQTPIPVTVAESSPQSLADGAATEAKQDTGNASLASIDGKLANPMPVTIAAAPLPAGAATSALQVAGNASLVSIDSKLSSPHKNRSDGYGAPGTGVAVDCSARPLKCFSIQVKGVGGVPTSWTVVLEVSLDGVNYDTLLTHDNVLGDGKVLSSGAGDNPTLFFRSRCTAVVLGAAASLDVQILGVQ